MKSFTISPDLKNQIEKMTFQELVVLKSYLEERNSHIKTRAFLIYLNEELGQRAFNMIDQVIISEK